MPQEYPGTLPEFRSKAPRARHLVRCANDRASAVLGRCVRLLPSGRPPRRPGQRRRPVIRRLSTSRLIAASSARRVVSSSFRCSRARRRPAGSTAAPTARLGPESSRNAISAAVCSAVTALTTSCAVLTAWLSAPASSRAFQKFGAIVRKRVTLPAALSPSISASSASKPSISFTKRVSGESVRRLS